MPARKPTIFKCEDCDSRFMTGRVAGGRVVCPFCGSGVIIVMNPPKPKERPIAKPKADWKYTGTTKNGQHLYRSSDGRERWLQHGEEALPQPAGPPDPKIQAEYEKSLHKTQKKKTTKKKQLDYRKRRYKLMKEGKWKGSMKESVKHAKKKK